MMTIAPSATPTAPIPIATKKLTNIAATAPFATPMNAQLVAQGTNLTMTIV